MSRERVIQLFEHDELKVGERLGEVVVTERDVDILARLHRQTRGRFYELIHRGVRFKQYVGVLKVGSLTIELLPKGDRAAKKTLAADAKLPWRSLFVQLLSRIGYIQTELGPRASVYLQHGSLIDLYVLHFLQAVRALCREGLVRAYVPRSMVRTALKGQIQFRQQMTRELRGIVGFDTRAAEYERGHVLNRVLLTALLKVKESRLSRVTEDLLPEILGYFEGVSPIDDPRQLLSAFQFDRRTERYRTAMDLAKPILISSYPGIRAGADDTFSMFFDMNQVWERFIFCELRRHAAKSGIKVDRQVSAAFWEGRRLRPDIVVHLEGGRRVVVDTKWKELRSPDPSDVDLRQMFAYNHQIKAVHSILLYPDIHGVEGKRANFGDSAHGCSAEFARIWQEREGRVALNRNVGEEVMEMAARVGATKK